MLRRAGGRHAATKYNSQQQSKWKSLFRNKGTQLGPARIRAHRAPQLAAGYGHDLTGATDWRCGIRDCSAYLYFGNAAFRCDSEFWFGNRTPAGKQLQPSQGAIVRQDRLESLGSSAGHRLAGSPFNCRRTVKACHRLHGFEHRTD